MSEPDLVETKRSFWKATVRILTSAFFVQRALLLVLAAILSGLVVPVVFKSVDAARENQIYVQRAQSKLFDDYSEALITYETLALDVSYYGIAEVKNVALQRKAFEKYSERVTELHAKMHILASRAQTLTSKNISKKMSDFMGAIYETQDGPIIKNWSLCAEKCDWDQLHSSSMATGAKAKALIAELASDLGLERTDSTQALSKQD
jgi:hypothetical protein